MTDTAPNLLAKAGQLSESRRVKPKPDTLPQEQQQPIKLSVTTVLDGKFIPAGDPLPSRRATICPRASSRSWLPATTSQKPK